MRDDWIDDMVREMEIGSEMGDIKSLVNGIKALFGVLEAMKLVSRALVGSLVATYQFGLLIGRGESPNTNSTTPPH